jgi:hypothetical protein
LLLTHGRSFTVQHYDQAQNEQGKSSQPKREAQIEQEAVKKQNSIDDAGLEKALAEQHFTRSSYREELVREILGQKFFQLLFAPRISITDKDIDEAYAEQLKRDPKLGKLDAKLKDELRSFLWSKKLARLQEKWVAIERARVHIERRL